MLLLGGGAYAAYRYDSAMSDRLMPGVRIAGIDVGGMTRADAIAALDDRVTAEIDREMVVQAGEETWTVTPRMLGAEASVEPLVDRALAVSQSMSWPERVFRRVFDRTMAHSENLMVRRDGAAM